MSLRDTLFNEGIKIGAYFIRNRKPKITTTIPTIQDLEERLKTIQTPEIPEQFPRPVLENPVEIPTESVSIETGAAKGTACNLCSDEHLSRVSGALSEAVRFARDEGLSSKEVIRRMRHARDELNAMERFDLAPEEVTKLPEDEKEVAHWALPKSRDLRHSINSIRSVKDLEEASAQAANTADEFSARLIKCKPGYFETKEETKPLEALKKMVDERKKNG